MWNILVLQEENVVSDCSDGDVRLTGGNTEYEGRLEVCINRMWGTVCIDDYYYNSYYYYSTYYSYFYSLSYYSSVVKLSRIVCHQLGHQELGNMLVLYMCSFGLTINILKGAVVYSSWHNTFEPSDKPIMFKYMDCEGAESRLLECSNNFFIDRQCTHRNDIGIKCEGTIFTKIPVNKLKFVLIIIQLIVFLDQFV